MPTTKTTVRPWSYKDDYLMHYGIKGMKWGVITKEYEPVDNPQRKFAPAYSVRRPVAPNVRNPVKANIRHPKDTTGRYGRGNIDLNNRKVVRNRDGSISTERSFSVNIDGKETLLPTVINGKIVSEDEAIDYYFQTGLHLGRFDTVEEAEDYAEKLHNRQDWYYNQRETPKERFIKEFKNLINLVKQRRKMK